MFRKIAVAAIVAGALAIPVAADAASSAPHANRSAGHRHHGAYGYAPEPDTAQDRGFPWPNPDRGPYPQDGGGGSC